MEKTRMGIENYHRVANDDTYALSDLFELGWIRSAADGEKN